MKLLALTEGPDHVCYRYRVAPFARALARAGWELEAQPLAKGTIARLRQLRDARLADAVLLQRRLLPWWQLKVLRRSARKLIYDLDDAVFHRDSYHPRGIESWQRMLRFWTTVYAADLIFCGNQFLCDQAASFIGTGRVRYFPTCVQPARYPTATHSHDGPVRLIWIGQRSTVRSLHEMHAQLRAATAACDSVGNALRGVPRTADGQTTGTSRNATECVPYRGFHSKIELRVISDVFPQLDGVPVVPIAWSSATEAAELAAADIGVSWLPDDRWSYGKCGLKVLQYMAAGLPVIANRVGVHRDIIVHGVTGFLADTPQEWASAVSQLANDVALRATMGASARRRVDEQYSVARWEERFVTAVDSLLPREQKTTEGRSRKPEHRRTVRPASAVARLLFCFLPFAFCLCLGCTSLARQPNALPTTHTLVLDPLVVYSDFSLPPHHRLLEELVLERNELLTKLQLPKSAEPVNVYLFDNENRFREFMRQFYPDFPQRRAFFVETDTRLAVYAQWGDRVAEDLRHEVAHGYLHSVVPKLPLWLDEGLAEYAEVPRGDAGLNRPHLQLLLEKLTSFGWKPDLARLERLMSATEMTQLDYAESWAWVHWLMETDPARRKIVQGYLDELRTAEVVPPFSVRIRGWFPQPEPMLVAHLRTLASSAR